MPGKRVYNDGCAAAHALDLIGERWALLVVRELLPGPRRFIDLQTSLCGISPTVLTQRLTDLEAVGVVRREQWPPPASTRVYALTDWGRELEPVLQALGRWGARSPRRPAQAPITTATLLTALKTMNAGALRGVIGLNLGPETYTVRLNGPHAEVTPGLDPAATLTLSGEVGALGAVIFGGQPLAAAEAAGTVRLQGDRALADAFVHAFPLPPLVEA
ncbi:winged helix-turn-helix transcriptional regulator [Deinococcus multiflagellatus]|uniref:Winged helix-turn-helix transcriptional regulator n=1 Tax=Deinococcus multiflagellatus TaxID=1656887 RepID=A0ABW1ZKC4_9DEIO|nr:winged helix-turn-helix transcriptional regulator [Deinococcus multiflagellatus]MBZ9712407.1 winged helix-turn-helix transcriptional regulator [Deinococcus multiflagellatus]